MTNATTAQTGRVADVGTHAADVSRVGRYATLYGLVLVFGWIGAMKFTAHEAGTIEGLVASTTAVILTFLFTAPGWGSSLGGFPALSVVPWQLLLKDAVLLGAALWILGDTLRDRGAAR